MELQKIIHVQYRISIFHYSYSMNLTLHNFTNLLLRFKGTDKA